MGKNEYGIYQMAYSTISYLTLFTFGFTSAYVKFYSTSMVRPNGEQEIARLNGLFFTTYCLLGMLVLIVGSFLSLNSDQILGGKLSREELDTGKILMWILVFNAFLHFPQIVFNNYIIVKERFICLQTINLICLILNPVMTFPLLLLGYRSVALAAALLAISLFKLLASVWYCLKKLQIRFCFHSFPLGLLKSVFAFSFLLFLDMLASMINLSLDRFLLGKLISSAAVDVYAVGGQLNTLYVSLSNAVSSVFTPMVNRLVAEGTDNKTLSSLFIKVGKLQFSILLLILLGFITFGRRFLLLWVGPGYEAAYGVAILLMGSYTIDLIEDTAKQIQRAMGYQKQRSVIVISIALMNIVISLFLIARYQEIGAAAGTALANLVGAGFLLNWFYAKRVGLNILRFWLEILRLVLACLPLVGFYLLTKELIMHCSMIVYVGLILAFICLYVILLFCFGLRAEERALCCDAIKKKLLHRLRKKG